MRGTIQRWLSKASKRPRRTSVVTLWTNAADADKPGLGRPEPELIALLEGEGDEEGEDREPVAVASGQPEKSAREGAA